VTLWQQYIAAAAANPEVSQHNNIE